MPHTPACRARIVEELMKTSAGAARVARMTHRQTRYLSEQIANQDVHDLGAEAAAAADGPPLPVPVVPPAAQALPSLRPIRREPERVEASQESMQMPELVDRDAEPDHVMPEEQQMGPEGDMELVVIHPVKPTDCSIPDARTLDERLKTDTDVRDIGRLFDVADREAGRERVQRISVLIHALGGDGSGYRREKARAARKIISEIYSVPCDGGSTAIAEIWT